MPEKWFDRIQTAGFLLFCLVAGSIGLTIVAFCFRVMLALLWGPKL